MDLAANLALGFHVALSTDTLIACMIGVTLGTFVGVLPGIGPLAGIALLLPITFYMSTVDALVMLAGIYYGGQYGASTSSILLNLPGNVSSAVTCLDGYPMSKQGRGGVALFMTTISSFLGGCFSIVLLAAFAPTFAAFALQFRSPEYFSMMILGLIAAATLSFGSPVKGLTMVVVGLLLGMVGTDLETGQYRFVFGVFHFADGLSLVVIAMGVFGIAEILANMAELDRKPLDARSITWRSLLPTREDWRRSTMSTGRGSLVGAAIGILPGAGSALAAFMAYAVEKRVARDPSRFGNGAIEGIAAPEAANNSAAQAAFIPTLTLGVPGSPVMALMLGALIMHGIAPGPQFLGEQPEMFWGLVVSFWIGNVALVILNLPLVGIWVRMLAIPYHILYPCILFFICVGVYSVNNSAFDILLVLVFGIFGYGMRLLAFPGAPMLLAFVLGPMIEVHLRRAMLLARGDPTVFLRRPISATFLAITVLLVALSAWISVRSRLRTPRGDE